ncbi:methyltransferase domain-containing protein [Candidatus Pacearchaeota archaeon]|nr:methyltransferase domain-containing protein [Candidatus Pacearchaeota archaeon]
MSKLQFILETIRHPIKTGDILPSQRYLIEEMLKEIQVWNLEARPLGIVEFGGGEGALTKAIVDRVDKLRIDYKVLSFEINSRLAKLNRNRFSNNGEINGNIKIIEDCVENLLPYLSSGKYGIRDADFVISSLPLSHFSKEKTRKILEVARESLRNGGIFTQYQHFPTRYSIVRDFFNDIKVSFVLRNAPPAFVYTCKK